MTSFQAYFDSLFLGARLTETVRGFSRSELHLLSYASCLLSLYGGKPVSDWDYNFSSTPSGLPYAPDLDEAISYNMRMGYVTEQGNLLKVTAEGNLGLDFWKELTINQERVVYLNGASDCLLLFTPNVIREAIEYEPAFAFIKRHTQTSWLFSEQIVDRLHDTFAELRALMPYGSEDLSLPLTAWLEYLLITGRENERHNTAN
ncbi:MAG: hypothetical protein JNJ91_13275 [Flavobacteriales bacterium]|nr:hypothetical protein [Flavobacteriales bacterium]